MAVGKQSCSATLLMSPRMFQRRQTLLHGGWYVSFTYFLLALLKQFQAHSDDYPILSHIAMDICAIPTTSVPCERLFSTGAEITTNRQSCLGTDRFEQLQILKHAWKDNIVDLACLNSNMTEEEYLDKFWEFLKWDIELVEWDNANETVIL